MANLSPQFRFYIPSRLQLSHFQHLTHSRFLKFVESINERIGDKKWFYRAMVLQRAQGLLGVSPLSQCQTSILSDLTTQVT